LTPLQLACQKGAFDCAVTLLNAKANPTLVKGGDPPLFYAVTADNTALGTISPSCAIDTIDRRDLANRDVSRPVGKLLEAGADVGQPNAKGQTLMEVLNPKCEIYRLIKKFLISRPGGQVCALSNLNEFDLDLTVDHIAFFFHHCVRLPLCAEEAPLDQ
jgi:ankyrin repeat protein